MCTWCCNTGAELISCAGASICEVCARDLVAQFGAMRAARILTTAGQLDNQLDKSLKQITALLENARSATPTQPDTSEQGAGAPTQEP